MNTSYCLEDQCYIAGVINPMFKSGKKFEENYDVIVPLDRKSQIKISMNNNKSKGQEYYYYKSCSYFELDQAFVLSLLARNLEFRDVDD